MPGYGTLKWANEVMGVKKKLVDEYERAWLLYASKEDPINKDGFRCHLEARDFFMYLQRSGVIDDILEHVWAQVSLKI